MAMLALEAAGEGSASAGAATADSGASSTGLSGGQKAGALGSALPKPRTHHPYIVGLTLMVVGAFALVGSITGTLPSMIAALFVPNALVDVAGSNPFAAQIAMALANEGASTTAINAAIG